MAKAKIISNAGKGFFDEAVNKGKKFVKGVISNTPILGIGADDATRAAVNRVRSVAGNARDIGVRLNDLNEGLKVLNSQVKDHMVKTGLSRTDALKALGLTESIPAIEKEIASLAAQRGKATWDTLSAGAGVVGSYFLPQDASLKSIGRSAARVATFSVGASAIGRAASGRGNLTTNSKGEFDIAGIPFI